MALLRLIPPKLCLSALPILFLLSLVISSSVASASNDDSLSAYQVLQRYNFPVGLLPRGVTGYELDRSTGRFKAFLNGSCSFKIESYDLKYQSTITGVITQGSLSSLQGVKVKILILWVNIISVTRIDDELQFSVGIASADFDVSNFYESPACGCGFDCLAVVSNQTLSHQSF
ncbi:uncharacterized protein At5g01610-like [Prosopis cineraria]|uniref:uncharacterized protein At5g01610-like n=1 Tax=Prosopis cineraria TaxID=364024 RepID=UPI0024107B30|nr:uncharacterized protein At5g01610-like [Prosopis cineraria]